jgi:serine protease AprX
MKKAYRILKALRNQEHYGSQWLFANSRGFNSSLDVKLIGRLDGNAKLNLLDANKKIVAGMNVTTEEEEVYDLSIKGLDNLPAGDYTLQYTDGTTTKIMSVTKQTAIANKATLKKPVVTSEAVQ